MPPTPATPSPTSATCCASTGDRRPAYADAVLAAYCERRGTDPRAALDLARAADLWALVELASRRGQNPVADRAHAHLEAIAGTGDLHALP
jgi:hypothetical protein